MAKNIINALFAKDEPEDEPGRGGKPSGDGGSSGAGGASGSGASVPPSEPEIDGPARMRSLPEAFERLAEQQRRLERRLEAIEAALKELADTAKDSHYTAKDQLKVLQFIGKFHEAAEKRGREMQVELRGVPDVLRTLPSATKEQAERLSEIAARLYEKAKDTTLSSVQALQANHQRAVEDLIEKSLGASRRATYAAISCAVATAVLALWIWLSGPRAR